MFPAGYGIAFLCAYNFSLDYILCVHYIIRSHITEGYSYMEQPRLALSVEEFAATVGISRSQAYLEIRNKCLKIAKVGKRTLVPSAEAARWLEQKTRSESDVPN
jgi:excisionase family DNA binding protein